MAKLILIKHALPVTTPGVPSEQWVLSEEGKRRCSSLAEAILPFAPVEIISSLQPKAAETGEIVAARLAIPFEAVAGLQEHDRSNVPHMPTREFISLVELFFRRPEERSLGRESADEALKRFETALNGVLTVRSKGNLAIVSHGTVIALLLAKHGGGRPFELWRKMGLPSYAVIDLPSWKVEKIVERVE